MLKPFKGFWNKTHEWGSGDTIHDIILQPGIRLGRNMPSYTLNHIYGNAILVGQIGSGMMSAMNTIALQAMTKYSPTQLRVLLLDTHGTEYSDYAGKFPHLDLVMASSRTERHVEFLTHIQSLIDARQEKISPMSFVKARLNDILMPRVLVFITDYSDLTTDVTCHNMLLNLMERGSDYGVHFLLITQCLKHVDDKVLNLCPIRFANRCSRELALEVVGTDAPYYTPDTYGFLWATIDASNPEKYTTGMRTPFIPPERFSDDQHLATLIERGDVASGSKTCAYMLREKYGHFPGTVIIDK